MSASPPFSSRPPRDWSSRALLASSRVRPDSRARANGAPSDSSLICGSAFAPPPTRSGDRSVPAATLPPQEKSPPTASLRVRIFLTRRLVGCREAGLSVVAAQQPALMRADRRSPAKSSDPRPHAWPSWRSEPRDDQVAQMGLEQYSRVHHPRHQSSSPSRRFSSTAPWSDRAARAAGQSRWPRSGQL